MSVLARLPLKQSNRVIVLDDNDAFRDSTIWLLESLDYQVDAYKDPHLAIERIEKNAMDNAEASGSCGLCLLLDVCMPMSGFDVHKLLRKKGMTLPVVYMTAHGDVSTAVAAMSEGALTLLEKPLNLETLSDVLTMAFSYEVQLHYRTGGSRDEVQQTRIRLKSLTPREAQVLRLILTDKSNQEIATSLYISIKTVELYRSRMMAKLKAKNAAHLVRLVMACGRY